MLGNQESNPGNSRKPFYRQHAKLIGSAVALLLSFAAFAATERYDYDANGRLIRWVDGTGNAIEYVLDAVGNIREVKPPSVALPPAISAVTPDKLRRGVTQTIQVTGSGLIGASLTSVAPDLDVSSVVVAENQISFTLEVPDDAALGAHVFTLGNAAGTASFQIVVDPVLPTLSIAPTPLAVPPDGLEHGFTLRLSNADNYDHSVSLSSANPSIATVSPSSVTLTAGQTELPATVTGLTTGTTAINLGSATLAGTAVPVFVTGEYAGINTSRSALLGVLLETEPPPPGTTLISPIAAPLVGIAWGPVIESITPPTLAQGTGPTDVVVRGRELQAVTGVLSDPNTGLTLGSPTALPDGSQVTIPVTVAADAPATWRRLTLSGANAPYAAAFPGADRLLVTLPQPVIESITPLYAFPGETVTLTVRGHNLQGASAVKLIPADYITLGATPVVASDGTSLTVSLTLSVLAATGPRAVQVVTPGAETSAEATAANTFTVASAVEGTVPGLTSAQVGVVLESQVEPPATTYFQQSPVLGMAFGPVATGLSPAVGGIGKSLTLTILGNELTDVTQIEFAPPDGITVGTPVVVADGKSLSVSLDIADSAPVSPRKTLVKTSTTTLPFSSPDKGVFQVVAPIPGIYSISPLHLVAGAASSTLTVRGENLAGALSVTVEPPEGITIAPPPVVNSEGNQLTINLSASADAALGSRVVRVTSAAGTSEATATAANTLHIVSALGDVVTPVASAPLGLVLESDAPPPEPTLLSLTSSLVGVTLQTEVIPVNPSNTETSALLGMILGPVATGMDVPYMLPGSSGELVVSGLGLAAVTGASIEGVADVSVTHFSVADAEVRVGINADSNAVAGTHRLRLTDSAGLAVPFAPAELATFGLAEAAPRMDSIDPILADQGDVLTLLVRGAGLKNGQVTVEPASGIQIVTGTQANSSDTELTVTLAIAADAAVGDDKSLFRFR
jgi:YD repeat-containing protein